MPKITKRVVDATKASTNGCRSYIWDSELKGFGVMITSRVKSYVLQYRTPEGRSRRLTIGRHGSPWTPEEARQLAAKLLLAAKKGNDPLDAKTEARVALTIGQVADLYLIEGPAERPNKKSSSWETDRSNIERHIKPLLGCKIAKSVTKADVARFQMDVAAGKTAKDEKTGPRGRAIVEGGKGIAARSLAVLSAMLSFAQSRGMITCNPAQGVRPYKGIRKERFLSELEVTYLGQALSALEQSRLPLVAAAAVRLLLLTGCRKNEILGLRWSEVDFEHGCLRLADSKTGAKVVPLAMSALELLASLHRDANDKWVLPATKGDGHYSGLSKHWEAIKERARALAKARFEREGRSSEEAPAFDGVRIHDLRHSFASFAVADGAALYLVGRLLGHKQARTTEIYAHVSDHPLRATAEIAARRIARAMGLREGEQGTDKVFPIPRHA